MNIFFPPSLSISLVFFCFND